MLIDNKVSLINASLPKTMHIDLNSCFAIIEQQANRLLRGRPVGVAAYDTPRGFVLAARYEAKAKGIKLGVNVEQARIMAPGIIILTPDPAKYREAHKLFKALMLEYTPDVTPKSIDEFVLNFDHSPSLRSKINVGIEHNQAMEEIAIDIKARIKERLGEFVTVNIGIGTNRFLAKYAAGFGKPDGMLLIDQYNIHKWYECGLFHSCKPDQASCKVMQLVDLPGINVRYRKRLRLAGIYTPTDFLQADIMTLKRVVFKSIVGYYWYLRLRGHEIDAVEMKRSSIGHQVALPEKTQDIVKLERLLMKLCEKAGRRLRKNNLYAGGIHLYLGFDQYRDHYGSDDAYVKKEPSADPEDTTANEAAGFNTHKFKKWSRGEKLPYRLYSTADIYEAAKRLLHQAEIPLNVKIISVTTFNLLPWDPEQLSLFEQEDQELHAPEHDFRGVNARKKVSDAVDAINNRYGEFIVTPATMMDMSGEILDRVAFGQVRDV